MRSNIYIFVFLSFGVLCNSFKPIVSYSRTKSLIHLQCKKCKYYKNDKKHIQRCTRFIKIHEKQHRLISKPPSYVIEDYFYVTVEESRTNNTLCGENAKEFVDKRVYWQ